MKRNKEAGTETIERTEIIERIKGTERTKTKTCMKGLKCDEKGQEMVGMVHEDEGVCDTSCGNSKT